MRNLVISAESCNTFRIPIDLLETFVQIGLNQIKCYLRVRLPGLCFSFPYLGVLIREAYIKQMAGIDKSAN